MKKILSCVMALSIAATAAMSASAASISSTTSSDTPVTYTVPNGTYAVTIPDEIELTGSEQALSGDDVVKAEVTGALEHNKAVKVKVTNANSLKLECQGEPDKHSITFGLYKDGNKSTGTIVENTTEILSVSEGSKEADLTIDNVDMSNAKCSGKYTGNITFDVSVA